MSKRIFKYPLTGSYENRIEMPKGAQVLTVQSQRDVPTLWALIDLDAPTEWRTFRITVTGEPLPDDLGTYVGTYQLHGGDFVGHLFEVKQ